MYLEELNIRNFRNYVSSSIRFGRGVNYIIGGNAQGKSNLIEAVYYLSTGRSFRTNRIFDLIKWGANAFHVRAGVADGENVSSIDVVYQPHRASLKLDGMRAGRMGDLVGILNTIIFSPEDLYIVKGSPGIRRRFIDINISQIHPAYLRALARYGRLLKQRNAAIRSGVRHMAHWDEQMVEFGIEIMRARARYIEKLCELARDAYSGIRTDEALHLTYRSLYSRLAGGKEVRDYHGAIRTARPIEEKRRTTLVGPHVDDIDITINGRDARNFASDGQRRSIIIALKLAQFKLVKDVLGNAPLLLIDDPLAELDIERRRAVMPFFSAGVQCIITTTEEDRLMPGRRFMVSAGVVEEIG